MAGAYRRQATPRQSSQPGQEARRPVQAELARHMADRFDAPCMHTLYTAAKLAAASCHAALDRQADACGVHWHKEPLFDVAPAVMLATPIVGGTVTRWRAIARGRCMTEAGLHSTTAKLLAGFIAHSSVVSTRAHFTLFSNPTWHLVGTNWAVLPAWETSHASVVFIRTTAQVNKADPDHHRVNGRCRHGADVDWVSADLTERFFGA